MDNKFHQIRVARSCGLTVPETITSNDRTELLDFARRCGAVALKFMSQDIFSMPEGRYAGLYVNKLSADEFKDFETFGENPITLQEYVEKDFEVRYTIVESSHFACKIESQRSERTRVDWRRYDIPKTPHCKIEPPEKIRKALTEFMGVAGICYGALDFIVDRSGNWWFLEVNTAGQWLWIEDLVELPISAKIAEVLSRWDRESADEGVR